MFDVGFSELMVIAVVALIVIGPERLPRVARTLGHLFGRMQRYVNDVKADITREMQLEELKKLQNEMEEAARSIESSVQKEVQDAQAELDKVGAEAAAGTTPANAPPQTHDAAGTPVDTEQLSLDLGTAPGEKKTDHKTA